MTELAAAAVVLVSTSMAGAPSPSADAPIERCRAESAALNTAKTIATCQAAAAAADVDDGSKVEALRLLGMALMVEGEAELAQDAFKKMLAIDEDTTLGADAGPNIQRVFEAAKVDVRAEKAAAKTNHTTTTTTTTNDDAGGKTGDVSATAQRTPPHASSTPALGWSLVGVGGAVALVGTVLAGGATYDRFFNRVACGVDNHPCVPFAPMLFGIYPAERRTEFLADSSTWIGGGVAAAGIGALGVGAGAYLAASE